jgi:hypothetical protein
MKKLGNLLDRKLICTRICNKNQRCRKQVFEGESNDTKPVVNFGNSPEIVETQHPQTCSSHRQATELKKGLIEAFYVLVVSKIVGKVSLSQNS